MANRKILYGYQIIHGDLVIQEEERLTVQNIFTTYLAGLSYQALADRMNADNIPFSQESPLWNKHKIKRMLENSRYAGENGYPPIIDQDTFQQVQEKISEKTSGKFPRRTESDGLWQKLRSGCCQTRLLRTGGPIGHTGNVHLKCSACRNAFVVGKEELLAQTARQLAAHETPVCKPYAPSAEAISGACPLECGLHHQPLLPLQHTGCVQRRNVQKRRTDRVLRRSASEMYLPVLVLRPLSQQYGDREKICHAI